MFCTECGKEIPDDATFCPYCGKTVRESNGSGFNSHNSEKTSNSISKIIIISIAVAAVIVLVILFLGMGMRGESTNSASAIASSAAATESTVASEAFVDATESTYGEVSEDLYSEDTTINYSEYSFTYTTLEGYEVVATIKVGEWIKASDRNRIDQEWSQLGGKSEAPIMSSFDAYSFGREEHYYDDTCAVVLGTVSFRNITDGYDVSEAHPISGDMVLLVKNAISNAPIMMVEYANERRMSYVYLNNGRDGGEEGGFVPYNKTPSIFTAHMTSNHWGPAPFMIAVRDVFGPKYGPGGKEGLENMEFRIMPKGFGTDFVFYPQPQQLETAVGFTIKKTWDKGDQSQSGMNGSESTTAEEEQERALQAYSSGTVIECRNAQIEELVGKYLQDLADNNIDSMNSYIVGRVPNERADEVWSQYIESGRVKEIYYCAGPETDSWIVFVYSETYYYAHSTPVPSMISLYVKKDAEENYRLYEYESVHKVDVMEAIRNLSMCAEMVELKERVDAEYNAALERDSSLENTIDEMFEKMSQ